MDGTPPDEVATAARVDPDNDVTTEPVDLALHKRRLLAAARSIDPLQPLRRHPVLVVVAAAALGLVAASPAAARTAQAAVSNGLAGRVFRMLSTSLWSYLAAMRAAQASAAAAQQETATKPSAADFAARGA